LLSLSAELVIGITCEDVVLRASHFALKVAQLINPIGTNLGVSGKVNGDERSSFVVVSLIRTSATSRGSVVFIDVDRDVASATS